MTASRPARTCALAVLALVALGGCAVPGGSGVRDIPTEAVPYDLLASDLPEEAPETASATTAPTEVVEVYLLDTDGLLEPSQVVLTPGTSAEVAAQVLERLEAGPTDDERALVLASALGPGLGLRVGGVDDGVVEVDVSGTTTLPAADQVPLAIGQIVLSLTGVPGVDAVRVLAEGSAVPLPLPGGRLTTDAVTAADYVRLTLP